MDGIQVFKKEAKYCKEPMREDQMMSIYEKTGSPKWTLINLDRQYPKLLKSQKLPCWGTLTIFGRVYRNKACNQVMWVATIAYLIEHCWTIWVGPNALVRLWRRITCQPLQMKSPWRLKNHEQPNSKKQARCMRSKMAWVKRDSSQPCRQMWHKSQSYRSSAIRLVTRSQILQCLKLYFQKSSSLGKRL